MDQDKLKQLVDNGHSAKEIANLLDSSTSTVRHYLKKYNLQTKWSGYLVNNLKFTDGVLLEMAEQSDSLNNFLERLGVSRRGGAFYHYKKRLLNAGFDLSKFKYKGLSGGAQKARLLQNKKAVSKKDRVRRSTLNLFLQNNGVIEICNRCNLAEWLGYKLQLDIDHIDKDKTNNSLNNLQYLCPNCHRLKHNGY
jgi:hypothetical protein